MWSLSDKIFNASIKANTYKLNVYSDGNWGAWSAYGTCSVTCGGGTQTHTRVCNNPVPANGGAACTGLASESVLCNTQICAISKCCIYS